MLLAGEDTTANSLAWAIWLLFEHPDCLARARAEIDQRVGDPSAWTIDGFADLAYVEACANEAMRLRPVVPFLMLQALRETSVAGIRIPVDTLIWGVMRSDSVREEYFADARSFRPDRWLGDELAHGAASANRIAMPFGAGPRVCPGRHLAMLEIKMALAVLLGRFDIADVAATSGGEPLEELSFTMSPEPLTMRLRRRR
jgi:cytochrome P450